MTAPPERRRGVRILARDTEYVRRPVLAETPPTELPTDRAPLRDRSVEPAPEPPARSAFQRIDLRLPVASDLVQAARVLAERAALPADLVLQLARRRAVARFRAALEADAAIPVGPAPRNRTRLRLTANFSAEVAQVVAGRFDPLGTGRSYGLVAPLGALLSEELNDILARAEPLRAPTEPTGSAPRDGDMP